MRHVTALVPLVCLLARPALAEPGFATPPGAPLAPEPVPMPHDEQRGAAPESDLDQSLPTSTARLSVGPELRIAESATDGGLAATLDLGPRALGPRLSGAWVRVGSTDGLSQYGPDLYVDCGAARRLHPIV